MTEFCLGIITTLCLILVLDLLVRHRLENIVIVRDDEEAGELGVKAGTPVEVPMPPKDAKKRTMWGD